MSSPLDPVLPLVGGLSGLGADELLSSILSTIPDGVYTIDPSGRITCWNPAMEEITGYGADEVVGETCLRLEGTTCNAGACFNRQPGCSLFQEGEVRGRRCRIRRKDGTWVDVVKNARLLRDPSGQILGGIETVTDITDQVQMEQEIVRLRGDRTARFHGLIGHHPSMARLFDVIRMAGPSNSSVLVTGETGTGKELVAEAIHQESPRSRGPLVRVSCAALSPGVLESELFGHVRGAFTGAVQDRVGRFEAANGGTLLLDEIGDVPLEAQTKLLRVLQEQQFERVGSSKPVRVDVRVVAATNRDLVAMCDAGTFRRDLYYRLAVIPLLVPPLRDRLSDLPSLARHFIARFNREQERDVPGLRAEALDALTAYQWPGNVRELEHVLEYAFVVSRPAPGALERAIEPGDLPVTLRLNERPAASTSRAPQPAAPATRGRASRPGLAEIRAALDAESGHRERAAARLGVSRMTLWKWMREHGLDWPHGDRAG